MVPSFRPFDPQGPVRVYVRNLPHWRQPGVTYFVTLRQADSIPAFVLEEWLQLRHAWYRSHGLDPDWLKTAPERFDQRYRELPDRIRRAFEREQAKRLHEELDRSHGSCVLRHHEPRTEVIKSLRHFHGSRLWLGDSVIMPNHLHFLVVPFDGHELEDLLGSIKKWTARHINQWLEVQDAALRPVELHETRPRFWQHESYDRIVRDPEELLNFRRYIRRNPTVARVREGEFSYSATLWLDAVAPLDPP